jgi:asparagine synthase (glutamine-hydrolysing)
MCGIAAILSHAGGEAPQEREIRQMLGMLRHRGPDQFGIYVDQQAALGSARLSIIDLDTGQQPISNENGRLWIVFNGEIFNYVELRQELEARGHRFSTSSDTEVVLHAYEEYGPGCLECFNGQFAIAIWDVWEQTLFLARDRLGIRPLFYTFQENRLIAASEIKGILADSRLRTTIDPVSLGQVFAFWSPLSPRTAFENVFEVPPGHYMLARQGEFSIRRYWRMDFPSATETTAAGAPKGVEEYLEELEHLLVDATRIRLRADVPVGAYLSGGLDSSTIAAMIRSCTDTRLDTFSIAFTDVNFDESGFQQRMARVLGTNHQVVEATHADIGQVFPQVIWHTEVPVLRTAPAPMFLLSKLVRDSGYKVVLTGEGADEFLAGYDIFKEAKVRRFWAAEPESTCRPLLLRRLYSDIPALGKNSTSFLAAFFGQGLGDTNAADYSHAVRWRNGRRNFRFFSDEVQQMLARQGSDVLDEQLHPHFREWGPLARAQYLEVQIFLSQYLLSSQGDRMGMAHATEGRFPFLDYRVVEFCNRLPARLKLRGLTEKYLLKQLGRKWLPREISERPKRPYRAPIHRSFFHPTAPEYVRDVLSPEAIRSAGFFKPAAVSQLVRKIQEARPISEGDDMALAGILSSQLVHFHFVSDFRRLPPVAGADDVKVCRGDVVMVGSRG